MRCDTSLPADASDSSLSESTSTTTSDGTLSDTHSCRCHLSYLTQSRLATAIHAVLLTKSVGSISSLWSKDAIVDADTLASGGCRDVETLGSAQTYVVHQDPKIVLVPNFLTDAEIHEVHAVCNGLWEQSGVANDSYAASGINRLGRTSSSAVLSWAQTPAICELEKRLACLAGMSVDHLEGLVGVRYEPGQFFTLHHDGSHRPVTIFLYLNDLPEEEGGETRFPLLGLKFAPRRGTAVMWSNVGSDGKLDSRLIHHAIPPKTKMKFGVNCFFHELPLRRANDSDDLAEGDVMDEFLIVLQRTEGERLGITTHDAGDAIIIDKVKDGLIARWNAANSSSVVEPGNRIVAANGIRGDAGILREACQGSGTLELTLGRRRRVEAA
mmetsp:Transcript_111784/g.216582  ORF Transcript_111784/g.216582 Transcript_111784/m.216582 type:complete len:383 (+) Transcript_111784:73-1221(+)